MLIEALQSPEHARILPKALQSPEHARMLYEAPQDCLQQATCCSTIFISFLNMPLTTDLKNCLL
jgi:hypothetical protein